MKRKGENEDNNSSSKHLRQHQYAQVRPSFSSTTMTTSTKCLRLMVVSADDVKPCSKFLSPLVRIFGTTADGYSVCLKVQGFYPYFFVSIPQQFPRDAFGAAQFKTKLTEALGTQSKFPNPKCIHSVEVKTNLQSINGYKCHISQHQSAFFKVTLVDKFWFYNARRTVTSAFNCTVYEGDLPLYMRYMVDQHIAGCTWVEVQAYEYCNSNDQTGRNATSGTSRCQIEAITDYKNVIPVQEEKSFEIAPVVVLSFDIECAGRENIFPQASIDPVIQIATCAYIQGTDDVIAHNVFCLLETDPIEGASVYWFETESELLQAFQTYLQEIDPDILTGYNIAQFDLPYLIERGETLDLYQYPYFGRMLHEKTNMRSSVTQSKAFGNRENKEFTIHGRVIFDMLPAMRREYKLRSYTLNAVSLHFLNKTKEDVHHSIIPTLQNGTSSDRNRLARYCLKDAVLPIALMNDRLFLINSVQMARVTGLTLDQLLSRGQQIRMYSLFLRYARSNGFIITTKQEETPYGSKQNRGAGVAYEGATVIEPAVGYYREEPVAVLDYKSLYPSIMIAYNLCLTTWITPEDVPFFEANCTKNVDYIETPQQHFFVTPKRRRGLIPMVLEQLLSKRKEVKRSMKNEQDPRVKSILNGFQLAVKTVANSVYGSTGFVQGRLVCLPISASVTSYGREMIEQTKAFVESTYTCRNGYQADASVVYGDTDSVMVKFGSSDLLEVMRLAQEASVAVTKLFPPPNELEYEKCYFPFLLLAKKRYAARMFETEDDVKKIDTLVKKDIKGLEIVRRDNCRLVKSVCEQCIDFLLVQRDLESAVVFVKDIIQKLFRNQVDIHELIISRGLSKTTYASRQPHAELAKRLTQRDSGSAPKLGDRVPYVVIEKHRDTKIFERAEDPLYAMEHNLQIDTHYYIENQLRKPLERIFGPVLSAAKITELFSGKHTLSLRKERVRSGPMAQFVVRLPSCLGCRCVLQKSERNDSLCVMCKKHSRKIKQEIVEELVDHQQEKTKIWEVCLACQDQDKEAVERCANKDCKFLYQRFRAEKLLKEIQGKHILSIDW